MIPDGVRFVINLILIINLDPEIILELLILGREGEVELVEVLIVNDHLI